MKKIFLGVLVFAFALTLSACGKQMQEIDKDLAGEMMKENSGGMISSIKDAMGTNKKMKCTYKIKNGEGSVELVTYVDGKKYRSESKATGMEFNVIYDGEDMHTWLKGQKKGTKMTKQCSEQMQNQNQEMNQGETQQNQEESKMGGEAFDGAMDVKCEEVGSIDFSVPTDIEFTDQCEMMKQVQNQSGDMQKQAEDMAKKYQNQMPQ